MHGERPRWFRDAIENHTSFARHGAALLNYIRFIITNPRFLAYGLMLTFFSSFGQTFFIALFSDKIMAEFSLDDGQYGTIYSAATLASGFVVMWLGRMIDHIDLRIYTLCVCIGLCAAALVMATAPNILVLGVGLFMLRQAGQGLLGHTSMTSMARYFDAHRGKAMSVAGLGYGIGEGVLPIATVAIIAAIGWRSAWLAIAGVLLLTLIPLSQWLLLGHKQRHQIYLEMEEHREREEITNATTETNPSWTRRRVLRDWRFYLIVPSIMGPGFIMTGFFFHHLRLVEAKGWEVTVFATSFAAFAVTRMVITPLIGPVVDRFRAVNLLPIYLIPLTVSLAILAMFDSPWIAYVFMILSGVTNGVASTVVGAMWAELYGSRHLGEIRAMATAIGVSATALSPIMMGWMIQFDVPLETILWMSCAYSGVGSILLLIVRTAVTRKAAM